MGATTFRDATAAPSADQAFRTLCEEAMYEHGHGGYTGTIAEKSGFEQFNIDPKLAPAVMHAVEDYTEASQLPAELKPLASTIKRMQAVYDDKWGPAVCIQLEDKRYVFFGWASC